MSRKNIQLLLLISLTALAFSACGAHHPAKDSADAAKNKAQTAAVKPDVIPPPTDVTEASLRGSDFSTIEGLDPIQFDYDSANLKDEALATLKKNVAFMKEHKENDFRVAGYCDERGTIEYNLALGQKRAKQVREYYIRLGIPAAALATISYGKENLVCTESTDECWAQNRRAETGVRSRTASNTQPDSTQPQ